MEVSGNGAARDVGRVWGEIDGGGGGSLGLGCHCCCFEDLDTWNN